MPGVKLRSSLHIWRAHLMLYIIYSRAQDKQFDKEKWGLHTCFPSSLASLGSQRRWCELALQASGGAQHEEWGKGALCGYGCTLCICLWFWSTIANVRFRAEHLCVVPLLPSGCMQFDLFVHEGAASFQWGFKRIHIVYSTCKLKWHMPSTRWKTISSFSFKA